MSTEGSASSSDLRSVLATLEAQGQLYRMSEPFSKDTELMPFFRLQFRGLPEEERRAILFEHVTGSNAAQYDMQVAAGVYGASEAILLAGLGCDTRAELLERFHDAMQHSVPPIVVANGPVQDEIHVGDDLQRVGLDLLPIPNEDPGFSQVIRTGMPMLTRDPETGIGNVGTYNGFVRDRDRIVAGISPVHDARRVHWQSARARGEDLPIAIAIGVAPDVMFTSSVSVPYGVDELGITGGLRGAPVELVSCKTIPLEVPASAEIVIEGLLSTTVLEPRLGFSEYPGLVNVAEDPQPVIRVTAITHRRGAIFTPILCGFPPTDHNTLWSLANSVLLYHELHYVSGFPLEDVQFPQVGAGNDLCVLRLQEDDSGDVVDLLRAAADLRRTTKYFIVVNHDIDARSLQAVFWALNYCVRPELDITVIEGRIPALDPSSEGDPSSNAQSRVLIDATRKGVYAPLGLPARKFMEAAASRWQRHSELPDLRLQVPWHSDVTNGWDGHQQRLADLITAGEYRTVGGMTARQQRGA